MSYTPPLFEKTASLGFYKFIRLFFYSFVSLLIAVIAIWRVKNDFAVISAIFGLYAAMFNVFSANYMNPMNQLIDDGNAPGIRKYLTLSKVVNFVPIFLSIMFLFLDFVCNNH